MKKLIKNFTDRVKSVSRHYSSMSSLTSASLWKDLLTSVAVFDRDKQLCCEWLLEENKKCLKMQNCRTQKFLGTIYIYI